MVERGGVLRSAEVMAALSLATDVGMGQPMEQGLGVCLLAVRFGAELGLGDEELGRVYDMALLRHIGCTAETVEFAEILGDELLARRRGRVVRRLGPADRGARLRAAADHADERPAAGRPHDRGAAGRVPPPEGRRRRRVRGRRPARRAAGDRRGHARRARDDLRAMGREGLSRAAARRGDPADGADRATGRGGADVRGRRGPRGGRRRAPQARRRRVRSRARRALLRHGRPAVALARRAVAVGCDARRGARPSAAAAGRGARRGAPRDRRVRRPQPRRLRRSGPRRPCGRRCGPGGSTARRSRPS
jgi:hypothetical protein